MSAPPVPRPNPFSPTQKQYLLSLMKFYPRRKDLTTSQQKPQQERPQKPTNIE